MAAPLLTPAHKVWTPDTWFSSPLLNGNLSGDVLPVWVVMCSQVGLSLHPLPPSFCYLITPWPAGQQASRPLSVWTLRLKGGVSVLRGCSASLGIPSQCCLPEGWSQCSGRAGSSAVTVPPRRLTHGSTLRNSVSGKEGYTSVLWASVPSPLHQREHNTGPTSPGLPLFFPV